MLAHGTGADYLAGSTGVPDKLQGDRHLAAGGTGSRRIDSTLFRASEARFLAGDQALNIRFVLHQDQQANEQRGKSHKVGRRVAGFVKDVQ